MTDIGPLSDVLREARARFATLVEAIRPELHRYCSRMTGSVLDGEDLVQETLAQAYYGLSLLRGEVALRPWLFGIAHHKCVDFLRSRRALAAAEPDQPEEPSMEIDAEIEDHELASHAFSNVILALPTAERAAVLLKDVLGHSLPEIAGILDTTVGGVKSALHRARRKLSLLQEAPPRRMEPVPLEVQRYVDTFNRRDWAALGGLVEQDVRCELVGHLHLVGREVLEKTYLATYSKLPYTWRLALGTVDGEAAIVCLREEGGQWKPKHAIRLEWRQGHVARIRDYADVPYLFRDGKVVMEEPQ